MLLVRYVLGCSLQICLFVLSLYTVGLIVTLPCEIGGLSDILTFFFF